MHIKYLYYVMILIVYLVYCTLYNNDRVTKCTQRNYEMFNSIV